MTALGAPRRLVITTLGAQCELVSPRDCLTDWPFTRTSKGRPAINEGRYIKRALAAVVLEQRLGRRLLDGMSANHLCVGDGTCWNPWHLYEGSAADNAWDAVAQGRRHRSHCRRGHEFVPENVYTRPDGSRNCRTCQRERAAA